MVPLTNQVLFGPLWPSSTLSYSSGSVGKVIHRPSVILPSPPLQPNRSHPNPPSKAADTTAVVPLLPPSLPPSVWWLCFAPCYDCPLCFVCLLLNASTGIYLLVDICRVRAFVSWWKCMLRREGLMMKLFSKHVVCSTTFLSPISHSRAALLCSFRIALSAFIAFVYAVMLCIFK